MEVRLAGGLKMNLARLAEARWQDKLRPKGGDPFTQSDLIRATVVIPEADQLPEAYELVTKIQELQVIKVTNGLTSGSQDVTINFIYRESILGEILLRFSDRAVNFYANRFIDKLSRAETAQQFQLYALMECNRVVEKGHIY